MDDTFKLGDAVVINVTQIKGTIESIWVTRNGPKQFEVQYADGLGTLHNKWLRADEITAMTINVA